MRKSYMLLYERKLFKLFRRPDHISQAAHSALTHETTLLDMNKLWKSDLSESVGTELSELLQDKRNETSNVSVAFSFVQALSDAK